MIYPIIDLQESSNPSRVVDACVKVGAPMVQLRAKHGSKSEILQHARSIRKITAGTDTKFIVNDHLDVALQVGADGIHLGQKDESVKKARDILGKDAIIGKSLMDGGRDMSMDYLNYVSFGPVFRTPVKNRRPIGLKGLEHLTKLAKEMGKTVFAIGGINLEVCPAVLETGCDGVAFMRAICHSPDPYATSLEMVRLCKYRRG